MNKVKMFFVAAALLLTTVGVFAGKAKFAGAQIYGYYNNGSTSGYVALAVPSSLSGFSATSSPVSPITFQGNVNTGVTYTLYYNGGTGGGYQYLVAE